MDVYPAKKYVSKDGGVKDFQLDNLDQRINLINKYSKHFIKNVHPYVIKVPKNILGDENHKWGLSVFHYTQNVYDYILSCYTLIMRCGPFIKIRLFLKYLAFKK